MDPLLAFAETTTTELSGADAGLAIGFVLFFAVIGIIYLVWYIWLILDMNKYPEQAWVSSAQNKSLWQILWTMSSSQGATSVPSPRICQRLAIEPWGCRLPEVPRSLHTLVSTDSSDSPTIVPR